MNLTKSIFFCAYSLLFFFLPARAVLGQNDFSPEQLRDFACLDAAYPALFFDIEKDAQGRIFLNTPQGRLLYDDGLVKSQEEKYTNGDIQDSMEHYYPLEETLAVAPAQPKRPIPAKDFDPGRVRSYPLLNALYGANEQARENKLVHLPFQQQVWTCSQESGMLEAAQAVRDDLLRLLAEKPHYAEYCTPFYSYCRRFIARTKRLSPHAYGIAVDCNPRKGPYWQWSKVRHHPAQQEFPTEIVRIFEKHGFIWGGKWFHFDVMHFEYRPEIIAKSRALHAPASKDSL